MDGNQKLKILNDIKNNITKQQNMLKGVEELLAPLTKADFPKVVLDKNLNTPKIFVVTYIVKDKIEKVDLDFINVIVTGEGFTRHYDYTTFRSLYVEYSEKYIRLNFPGEDN